MNKIFLSTLTIFFILCLTSCRKNTQEESGLQHPNKKIKNIDDFNEALQACDYYKKSKQSELAIKSLERAILLSDNQTKTEQLVLELADMLLAEGNFERAQKVYKEFKSYYPGSTAIEYALYKELLSYHLAALSSDRDQTNTHQTVTLAQHFLNRFEQSNYRESVCQAQNLAYHKLWDTELNQVEFYLNKFTYEPTKAPLMAARNRLAYMKEHILPHLTNVSKITMAQLETQLSYHLQSIGETMEPIITAESPSALSKTNKDLQALAKLARTLTVQPLSFRDRF